MSATTDARESIRRRGGLTNPGFHENHLEAASDGQRLAGGAARPAAPLPGSLDPTQVHRAVHRCARQYVGHKSKNAGQGPEDAK